MCAAFRMDGRGGFGSEFMVYFYGSGENKLLFETILFHSDNDRF